MDTTGEMWTAAKDSSPVSEGRRQQTLQLHVPRVWLDGKPVTALQWCEAWQRCTYDAFTFNARLPGPQDARRLVQRPQLDLSPSGQWGSVSAGELGSLYVNLFLWGRDAPAALLDAIKLPADCLSR